MAATFLITPTAPSLFFRKDERFSRIMVHALNDILLRILDPFPAIRSSSNLVRSLLFYFICYKRDSFFKKMLDKRYFFHTEKIMRRDIFGKFRYSLLSWWLNVISSLITLSREKKLFDKLIIVLDWLSNNTFSLVFPWQICVRVKRVYRVYHLL